MRDGNRFSSSLPDFPLGLSRVESLHCQHHRRQVQGASRPPRCCRGVAYALQAQTRGRAAATAGPFKAEARHPSQESTAEELDIRARHAAIEARGTGAAGARTLRSCCGGGVVCMMHPTHGSGSVHTQASFSGWERCWSDGDREGERNRFNLGAGDREQREDSP